MASTPSSQYRSNPESAPLGDRIAHLQDIFVRQFGLPPTIITRAPGRVNLIGEHTDYNDGFVLPVAIARDTLVAARSRNDHTIRVYSATIRRASTWTIDSIQQSVNQPWSNYIRGITRFLYERDLLTSGADLAITSTVPLGAGVSSSAALEVSSALAFLTINDTDLPPVELALLCQRVENEFVGVQTGIMDQFIARLAEQNHALLIDCQYHTFQQVPLPKGYILGIADTGVKHGLVASEYNKRRQQCEEGVSALQRYYPNIHALRDVTSEQLALHANTIPPIVFRRCRHVITENERVMQAITALHTGNLDFFGELMYASHASLHDDYEVTIPELDTLVEAARSVKGVIGSRMTGGGFGGSTITIMEEHTAARWARALRSTFQSRFGRIPLTFTSGAVAGASIVWRATD